MGDGPYKTKTRVRSVLSCFLPSLSLSLSVSLQSYKKRSHMSTKGDGDHLHVRRELRIKPYVDDDTLTLDFPGSRTVRHDSGCLSAPSLRQFVMADGAVHDAS